MKNPFPRKILPSLLAALSLAASASAADNTIDPAAELYFSANALYNRDLYELSAQQYQEFLQKFPQHEKSAAAQFGLALSRFGLGKYAEAEPELAKVAANPKAPEQEQAAVLRGQCLLALDKAAEAEKIFIPLTRAKDNATKEKALAGLAEALQRQKKWQEMLGRIDELNKVAPQSPYVQHAKYQAALGQYELGKFKEAAALLEPLVQQDKTSPLAQQSTFMLAECKRELGDLNGAAQFYDAASKLTGAYTADALFRLGFTQFQQQKFDESARTFEEVLAKHKDTPNAAQAGLYLGRYHFNKNDLAKAETFFRPLIADPALGTEATAWLGKTLLRQKKFNDAANVLGPVLAKVPGQPILGDMLFDYANAVLGAEKFQEAADNFARQVKEFPQHPQVAEAMRLRAFALHRLKKYPESAQQCDEFLAKFAKEEGAGEVSFLKAENLFLANQTDPAIAAYRAFAAAYPQSPRRDAAQFRLGQSLYQQQKWQEAKAELEPLAAKNPTDPLFAQLHYLLGACYFQLQNLDGATTSLEKFLAQYPKDAAADSALYNLGLAWQRKKTMPQAQAAFQRLAAEFPQSAQLPMALVELGRMRYEAKQYDTARQALAQVAAGAGAPEVKATAAYYLGWVSLEEKKWDESAQHFASVADGQPKHELAADARLQQAMVLAQKGDAPNAQAALDKFTALLPQDPRLDKAFFLLGNALVKQEKWQAAGDQFRKITAQFPKSELMDKALYQLAWAEKALKRPDEAQKAYAQLLTAFPASELAEAAAFESAELDFQNKKYDESIARLSGLAANMKDAGTKARALYRLGWAYAEKGQPAEAAKNFEAMLAVAPPPPLDLAARARYQAGEAQLKLKAYPAALPHFQQAAAAPPEVGIREQALIRVGDTQALLEQWAEAEKTYAQFTAEFPKNELAGNAHFGLGWARENQKKHADAIAAYGKATALGTRTEVSARSQFQTGECLFAMEKFDEAIKELTKVEVNYAFPLWSSRALLEIGRILDRKGNRPQAVERFQEVVQKYPDSEAAKVAKDLMK